MTPSLAVELLAGFLARMDRGETPDFEALVSEHPGHATELRRLFDEECERLERESLVARLGPPPLAWQDGGADFATEVVARLAHRTANFARYQMGAEIGQGGMGTVRRVWDVDLRRDLAMKTARGDALGRGAASESARLARFLQEAQVTSRLDHPGIVPVHELGLDPDGCVYFTMKLVNGRTFAELLQQVRAGAPGCTQTRAIGVIQRVCEAVAYAHSRGVLHRDLKPANIMVGEFGEVYVMDWGLARLIAPADRQTDAAGHARPATEAAERASHAAAASPLLTRDGQIVGTPAYMAPEQAAGRLAEVGPHSDVYAVGAMLYHLFAGQPPHVDRAGREADGAASPRAPQRPLPPLPAAVPAELAAICERAMAPDWRARYGDISLMAADLAAFMEGRVVRAYETGALAEARKWVRRNRAFAGALAAALLALVAGVAVSLTQKLRADAHALEATQIASFLEQTIAGVKPSVALGRDTTMLREMMDAAWARIDAGELADAPQAELRLTWLIGDALRELGEAEHAQPILRRAVAAARALGADGDPYLAWSLADLALVEVERGDSTAAETFAREALERSRELYAADDPNVTTRLTNLALVLSARGADAEAEGHLREALDACRRRSRTGDDEEIAEIAQCLGTLLHRRGHAAEAESLMRESLAAFERLFPDTHPSVATALCNLANLLQGRGELVEAERLATRSLAGRRTMGGRSQAALADSLQSLGSLRHALRDLAGAEPLLREALAIRQQLHPDDDEDVASSLNNLGALLRDRGDNGAAEGFLREALEMRRRLSPGDSRDLALCLNNFGMLLLQRGDARGAEDALSEALGMLQRLGGGSESLLRAVHVNLGQLRQQRGDLAGAEAEFRAALEIARAAPAGSATAAVRAAISLGDVLLARERFAEAAVVLGEIEAVTRDAASVHPGDRRRCLKLLADTHAAWEAREPGNGHAAEAEAWAKAFAALPDR